MDSKTGKSGQMLDDQKLGDCLAALLRETPGQAAAGLALAATARLGKTGKTDVNRVLSHDIRFERISAAKPTWRLRVMCGADAGCTFQIGDARVHLGPTLRGSAADLAALVGALAAVAGEAPTALRITDDRGGMTTRLMAAVESEKARS